MAEENVTFSFDFPVENETSSVINCFISGICETMAEHSISINNSTESDDEKYLEFISNHWYAERVFIWILSVIEIPVMILTLIALGFLIKSRPAASVFVSNLILSDLIQVLCILTETISWSPELENAHRYFLIVGLYFMACVAFERYLLVSHPIWYKSHHSLKLSCFISLIVWFVPLICAEIQPPHMDFKPLPFYIACLIPYPIVILCFAGTWRGLSHSISLSDLKRRLILGSLFLVLLTYTFLILPIVILELTDYFKSSSVSYKTTVLRFKFWYYFRLLLFVNPLADCMLYLFMRPDVGGLMKSVRCCCRRQSSKHNQDTNAVVNPQNSCTTVVCCISAQTPASHSMNTCSSV